MVDSPLDSESMRGTVNLRHVFASYSDTLSAGRLEEGGCVRPLLNELPPEGPVGVEGESVAVTVDAVEVIVDAVSVIVEGPVVDSREVFEAFDATDAWEPCGLPSPFSAAVSVSAPGGFGMITKRRSGLSTSKRMGTWSISPLKICPSSFAFSRPAEAGWYSLANASRSSSTKALSGLLRRRV